MPSSTECKLCPMCGKRTRVAAVVEYRSKVKLDRKLIDVHIPELEAEQCTSCKEQFFGASAGVEIDNATRRAAGRITPAEVADARKVLGAMSQADLARAIGAAPEAMNRWSQGHVIQGRLADTLMRVFFEVPEARVFLKKLWATPESNRRVRVQTIVRPRMGEFAAPGSWQVSDGGDLGEGHVPFAQAA